MVEVRQVQTDGYQSCYGTGCRCFQPVHHLFLADGFHEPRYHHEEDDEQVVVGHLDVVGANLEGSEDSCNDQSPQVFAAVGQHDTCNHRRQIGQRPHLPDVSGGNDNQEVGREGPQYGAQSCQIATEVEGAQQNVEAQEVRKQVPHVLGQPQVVGIDGRRQRVGAVVRRCRLERRHAAEQSIRPARTLTRALIILQLFLTSSTACRGVVTEEDATLRVGREEIGKSHYGKQ